MSPTFKVRVSVPHVLIAEGPSGWSGGEILREEKGILIRPNPGETMVAPVWVRQGP